MQISWILSRIPAQTSRIDLSVYFKRGGKLPIGDLTDSDVGTGQVGNDGRDSAIITKEFFT